MQTKPKMIKIIFIPEEKMWDSVWIHVLLHPEDIVFVLAIAYAPESFALLDKGIVYSYTYALGKTSSGHELRRDILEDTFNERSYVELSRCAQ